MILFQFRRIFRLYLFMQSTFSQTTTCPYLLHTTFPSLFSSLLPSPAKFSSPTSPSPPPTIPSINFQLVGLTPSVILEFLTIRLRIYFQCNAVIYKQTSRLPMRSSIVGLLPITYMDELECTVLNTSRSCISFSWYIEHILIITYSKEEAIIIYRIINIYSSIS